MMDFGRMTEEQSVTIFRELLSAWSPSPEQVADGLIAYCNHDELAEIVERLEDKIGE